MAVVFPYVKNTAWADGSGGGTPITAAKMNVYEDGIFNAHQQPAVRVTHNAAQSIANNTDVVVAFNTERFDTAGGAASTQHDTVTNNSRLTCKYAGKYQISACVEFASNASGARHVKIRLNGTTVIAWTLDVPGSTGSFPYSLSTLYDMAVNDYVELLVNQNSGGALNLNSSGNYSPEFMFVRVA